MSRRLLIWLAFALIFICALIVWRGFINMEVPSDREAVGIAVAFACQEFGITNWNDFDFNASKEGDCWYVSLKQNRINGEPVILYGGGMHISIHSNTGEVLYWEFAE